MNESILHLNAMPSKTWYWLKVNGVDIKLYKPNGKSIVSTNKTFNKNIDLTSFDKINGAMGNDFSNYMKDGEISCHCFDSNDTLFVTYEFENDTISSDSLYIDVQSNVNAKVYMVYKAKNGYSGTGCIQTKVRLGENSKLQLFQVSMVSKEYNILNDIGVECDKNAYFENTKIMLGSTRTYSGICVYLLGDKSSCREDLVYYGDGNKIYDFNYVINHIGKNTNSEIYVNGTLDDNSNKTFRGTIDFKCGASGSVGFEKEDVLLLGNDVVNKTVPIILCSEEDVKGNHGASIGRIDDENLFYLMSRGLSEDEIKHLLSYSKVMSKAKMLECDEITNQIATFALEEIDG